MLINIAGVNSGVIGGFLAVVLLGLLTPLVKKLSFRWNSRNHQGYSRELSSSETKWLATASKKLSLDKSNQKYPKWTLLLWSGTIPVVLGMGIFFIIIYLAHKIFVMPIDEEAINWLRIDFGVSFVLSTFLGIFVAAIAMISLAKVSPNLRDYLTYIYGWGYLSPKSRGQEEVYDELEHQLRREKLTSSDAYDSERFSNLIFHRTSPVWKKWTAGVFLLTIFFFILDCRYSVDLYEDQISISPYFSLIKKQYDLNDVESVVRECTLGSDDGKAHPYLSYELRMQDGQNINLFSLNGEGKTPNLDAIERILPRLKDVNFLPTRIDSAPIVKMDPTSESCIRFIQITKDVPTANRIINLFNLEK